MPTSLKIDLNIQCYSSFEALPEIAQTLMQQAQKASEHAYAPYSNFHVGAALLLENGKVVIGTNQENAAYPSGLCAERVAFFSASTQYPKVRPQIVAVAAKPAAAKDYIAVTPCGGCRQVMREYEILFEQPIQLVMQGENEQYYICNDIQSLLPLSFSGSSLK